jgi:hypothetical protein
MEDYKMKKIIALALTLVLALSLAACGGGTSATNPPAGSAPATQETTAPPVENTTPESPPPAKTADNDSTTPPADNTPGSDNEAQEPSGKAMDSLIAWMMDGTFSYDYTLTSEGPDGKTEGSGSMAMDGDNIAAASEMTVEGQTVKARVIIKDGTTYIVDDVNKFIMTAPSGMDATQGMMTDYSGIAKIGEGTGEIGGKTLPYEEYAESETGATIRYYLDGGQVYGIESEYEGYKTVMIISNPKNSAPAGAFDLPEGYTQM